MILPLLPKKYDGFLTEKKICFPMWKLNMNEYLKNDYFLKIPRFIEPITFHKKMFTRFMM